ncbi:MAG: hypothetical protein RR365_11300 [Bacteroides sp.]
MAELTESSLVDLINGSIKERVDYEARKIYDNILDPNTKATTKRKLTVTFVFQPDEDRRVIALQAESKPTLAPTNPVTTALCVTSKGGQLAILEMTPQVPGQTDIYGGEQSQPKIVKIANAM